MDVMATALDEMRVANMLEGLSSGRSRLKDQPNASEPWCKPPLDTLVIFVIGGILVTHE